MEASSILGPVVALVAWSLLIMGWMAMTRIPAMRRKGIMLKGLVGGRGQDLEGVIDREVQWKAHNYAHLMEQPTLFYAIALTLAIMGEGDGVNLILAWIYVGFRVAHSLVQTTTNIVLYRFLLFLGGSTALILLTLSAAILLLTGDIAPGL